MYRNGNNFPINGLNRIVYGGIEIKRFSFKNSGGLCQLEGNT